MNSLELSSMSDEKLNSLELDGKTFGVIGVCGIVGNLVARILMDRGYKVIGTDMSSKENCRFDSSFEGYDIKIYYGGHPKAFFKEIDYVFVPPSLPKKAKVFDFIKEADICILELGDIFKLFKPDKKVICISGTNGKTTTTQLLKKIAYSAGLKPCEHNLEGMQGNNEFIPSLQDRLNGDIAILETGTDGTPGGLKSVVDLTHPNFAILTNITPDHLVDPENTDKHKGFLDYAKVKGELIQGIEENEGTLIYNSDDPTVVGLLQELDYRGKSVSFGLDYDNGSSSTKPCWCGREIEIDEVIYGCGVYDCECGIRYEKPDYIASNISLENRSFTLEGPDGVHDFKLAMDGLHNIYNAVGAIIASRIFLDLSDDEIQNGLSQFTGALGRMEVMGEVEGKTIMVDYAHNPAGVKSVLQAVDEIYGKVAVVITVTSESGEEGDIEILKNAIGNVDYIIPASYDCKAAADKLLSIASEGEGDYDLNLLSSIFVFTEGEMEQKGVRTLGASQEQVLDGLETALKTDADLVLCLGEAAFKFDPAIKDFCKNQ